MIVGLAAAAVAAGLAARGGGPDDAAVRSAPTTTVCSPGDAPCSTGRDGRGPGDVPHTGGARTTTTADRAPRAAADDDSVGTPADAGQSGDTGATPTTLASAPARTLGSVSVNGPDGSPCPGASTCTSLTVRCAGSADAADAVIAQRPALGAPLGMVVLLSGELGTDWWTSGGPGAELLTQLAGDHLATVQVRWTNGWLTAATGEPAGPASLACRPATILQWIHDALYAPLDISGDISGGVSCGFCVTGNSGGASAAIYATSLYPLRGVDAVIASSGPTLSALADGCLHAAGREDLWYEDSAALTVDRSYGFPDGGPCLAHDGAFALAWDRDQVDATTAGPVAADRVLVILGLRDQTSAPAHATAYLAWSGAPVERIADMEHTIQLSPAGLRALRAALTS